MSTKSIFYVLIAILVIAGIFLNQKENKEQRSIPTPPPARTDVGQAFRDEFMAECTGVETEYGPQVVKSYCSCALNYLENNYSFIQISDELERIGTNSAGDSIMFNNAISACTYNIK